MATMERGDATRGKVAALVSGANSIEIKATIPEAQIDSTLARFGLTIANEQERYIYFYDTAELDLNKAGIITRARRVVGDDHDSTVKFRPVVPDQVAAKWRTFPLFKIEADASEKGVVKSASFSMQVPKGVIKRIAAGDKPIGELFTKDQQAFLLGMANRNIDFSKLQVLGPLRAHRWKFDDPGCPWPITAELWVREDGARLMEASIKTPVVQAAAGMAGFMAFLAEFGAERDIEEQAKTRWALEYYANKLRKARAGRGAAATATSAPKAAKAKGGKAKKAKKALKKGKATKRS
jgi:hypothetical protein